MKRLLSFFFVPAMLLAQTEQPAWNLNDIFGSGIFYGKSLSRVQWMKNGKRFSYEQYDTSTKSQNIFFYDVTSGKRELAVDVSKFHAPSGDSSALTYSDYRWSPDERSILFVSEPPAKQYFSRRTPAGNFFLYNLKQKTFRQLTDVSEPMFNPKFSPDGARLGFVRGNNIFVLDIATGTETQLTFDGAEHVINGKFDWVYEEEFSIADGWQWSPDGQSIAFWHLDETRVPEFHLVDFMTLRDDVMPLRYPKAGDPNAIVRIGVVSIETKHIIWMNAGTDDDIYIPRVQWFPNGERLAIQKLNRLQNKMEVLEANAGTGSTRVLFADSEKTWIDEQYDLRIVKSEQEMLWISERDGYPHIYLYNFDGTLIRQITKGAWEVAGIVGIDEAAKLVYFTADSVTPLEKQLYAVSFDGGAPKQLTANGYSHTVNFSPDAHTFLDYYSNAATPTKIALCSSDKNRIRIIEENSMKALQPSNLALKEFFTFTTSDSVKLYGWMIKPSKMDLQKKYPVLFDVYGGPKSQNVVNTWGGNTFLWYQMLAQKGYIVVAVDGRGTGGRGKSFSSVVYRNLGTWEVHDQIEAVKYLSTLSYVDTSRIGIWGWSYGGYMAVSAILRGGAYFKTAVAVAPVTDWRLYDDVYTERYMGLPGENVDGYNKSSTLTYADQLQGNLFILHGTTDDNVHWQNSIQLIDALEKSGKQFRTMFYPNKNHSIYGGNTRLHLFEAITDYILEKL
ncbi:MAG TPA: S9 family peptidase [Bacteroidota bacterium]|nr:S9 family peptidase [Bacteroidota bacterium]